VSKEIDAAVERIRDSDATGLAWRDVIYAELLAAEQRGAAAAPSATAQRALELLTQSTREYEQYGPSAAWADDVRYFLRELAEGRP
jgi:hypothetical protein